PGEGADEPKAWEMRAAETAAAKNLFDRAKTRAKKKSEEIKSLRLSRAEAMTAREAELKPLEEERERLRAAWRDKLQRSAPDRALALGANLTVSDTEFRAFCEEASVASNAHDRAWADFCAAFGCEFGADDNARMTATPLALVAGSGHQDFLSSVSELMVRC